jgi:hypothetical protein
MDDFVLLKVAVGLRSRRTPLELLIERVVGIVFLSAGILLGTIFPNHSFYVFHIWFKTKFNK